MVAPEEGQELDDALRTFLEDRLRLSTSTLGRMGPITIKKVFSTPSSKIQHEVIALLESQEERDAVKRAAKELAGDKDACLLYTSPSPRD